MTERTKMDAEMPPAPLDSATTHARLGVTWLVVTHVAVGILASLWASPDGGTTDVARGALSGLWMGQASVLGVWLGLGTTRHWMRLAGSVLGVVVICRFSKIASGDLEINSLGFLLVATAFVATPLLISRSFYTMIHMDWPSANRTTRLQFSILHLLMVTFLVACVVTLGKVVPHFFVNPHRQVIFGVADYAVLYVAVGAIVTGVAGIIPAWLILATKRPVLYGIGLVAIPACLGYCLSWIINSPKASGVVLIVLTTPALVVVVSLLVVRSCGYRLVRLPKPSPRGSGLEEITTRQVGNRDSQSISILQ